jgi:glycyl-tRNA synthetase (class II)
MAEIEHFCDPRDKSHPKFEEVADVEAALYSACDQEPILTISVSAENFSERNFVHLFCIKFFSEKY